jgi:FAD/FMN-containing dehydrogenase
MSQPTYSFPGQAKYADACSLFNGMIERRPRMVAHCSSAEEVASAVAFARLHDLEVAVRAGGHSVAGQSLVDDGLVLDVRGIDEVSVDPIARTARVGGGATWAPVDAATQAHGLATTGGRVSNTGVVGLTIGGGSGWLERKHGLACDNLLAAELVTADGRLVRASADENPDLFWALHGGGGNFGVVTALEFRLHPLGPEVMAGLALYPVEHGRALIEFFRDSIRDAPEELDIAAVYVTAPAEEGVPEDLHGKVVAGICGMYAGSVEDGEAVLAPWRAFGRPAVDMFGPMPYVEFQCMSDLPSGYRNWWTAEQLADLPREAIDRIASRSEQLPPGLSEVLLAHWGGAIGRVGAEQSPLAGRHAPFVVHPLMLWEDATDDEAMIAHGRGYRSDLAPWASGAAYQNFTGDEGEARRRAAFLPGALERLAQVKAQYDPRSVFSPNPAIRPASSLADAA